MSSRATRSNIHVANVLTIGGAVRIVAEWARTTCSCNNPHVSDGTVQRLTRSLIDEPSPIASPRAEGPGSFQLSLPHKRDTTLRRWYIADYSHFISK
jgi:hypothetical protein